ncbi:MAG: hypothetical protein JRJ85_05480 [Deltaproteobacteria bacterium]|nr:hypothetical protein [Deltaproteobacteria bacterium]
MGRRFIFIMMLFGTLLVLFVHPATAQQTLYYYEEPLELNDMDEYEDIGFENVHFTEIKRGMSQRDVLMLLGKPLDLKKIKRKKNRWTFHYYYPDGYVVNFKNGLVVGKEKMK